MKRVLKVTSIALVGTLLLSNPIFANAKSRVPEKVIYTGLNYEQTEEIPLYYNREEGKVGLKPSVLPDEVYLDPEYFFVNEIPYTLPVGQIKLSKVMGKDLGKNDVTLDVKKGKQKLTAVINGKALTSKYTEGIPTSVKYGEFKDVPKNHWAYADIRNAVAQGWIRPESDTVFGLKKDVQGKYGIERGLSLTKVDVWYGLNAVLMSNGIVSQNTVRSRGSTEIWTKPGENGNAYIDFPGKDILPSLNFASNMAFYEGAPDLLFQVMGIGSDEALWGYGDYRKPYTSGYEYNDIAYLLQMLTHKMGFKVTDNLSKDKYIWFDFKERESNLLGSQMGRDGSAHYGVSRGLLTFNEKYAKLGDIKGAIGREQFAVILGRLDRAIKASGFINK